MTRLVLLPLDDRPVNYDQPWWLGRAAGIDVRRPPRDWLGNPFRDARRDQLTEWLADEGRVADGLVVAVDTLAYGGLIPSRQSNASLSDTVEALEPLRSIKVSRPDTPIFAFSVLMRVSRSNSAEEEKPYWRTFGRDLFRLSYLGDKVALGDADQPEMEEARALAGAIPPEIISDYRAGRDRNSAINRMMLDWVDQGLLDYALIAQDDTAPYGWNVAEARALHKAIVDRGLRDRATVYPGADEVASLLVAAFACRQASARPAIWTRYSGIAGPSVVTAFEDRPLGELVQAHLGPLDAHLGPTADDADLVLTINAPTGRQAEAWPQLVLRDPARGRSEADGDQAAFEATRAEMLSTRRDVDELTEAIAADVAVGRNVAIVDVAFVNGADLALAEALLARVPLARLGAYGAWNTAGNTLGGALAQGAVRALTRETEQPIDALAAHLGLLAIHWLDDYAFQGVVRTELLVEDLPDLGIAPSWERLPDAVITEVERRLHRRLLPHVEGLARQLRAGSVANGAGVRSVMSLDIEPPSLPWHRVFEVVITPSVRCA